MMIDCSFLPVFYEHHRCIKMGEVSDPVKDFAVLEEMWMNFYGLGKFETYRFMYEQCASVEALEEWVIRVKGEEQVRMSSAAFDDWIRGKIWNEDGGGMGRPVLSDVQRQIWKENGYIIVSGLVDGQLCDAVADLICTRLGVDLSRPETWYNSHPDWHGLMLQLYQDKAIHAIKNVPALRQLFAELYGTSNIIANTEKVSFNPPETSDWKFRHQKLHWDIDFAKPDRDYIQGLVYLNDVPENRGPLTVVPGFHHRFGDWMKAYPDPHVAQDAMRSAVAGSPVPGKKGDIVLWLQTLPHSASANHSDLPRFVQYVSFTKC